MSAQRIPPKRALRLAGADVDEISVRLDALDEALRMPDGETRAIRDELESHLRERVRDLELAGMPEGDAVRCAAAELGDISHMARRYREARAFPRRRLIMNLSMFAVAGAVLVVGAVTLTQAEGGARVSVFAPPAAAAPTAQERTALARPIEANFNEAPAGDVFGFLSETIGMPINVAWSSMPGKCPDCKVTFIEKNADFGTVLADIGESLGSGPEWTISYRLEGGSIRVATEAYFDRHEMVLASYDLSPFADTVSNEQLLGLLHDFVYPAGWNDNGGDLARASIAGNRMFVEAPKRYHVQIQWFIDELAKGSGGVAPHADSHATP